MLSFTLKRLLTALPTLLLVSLAVFALVRAVPGDPASLMLGDMATEASVADLRAQMGLDRPLVTQFGLWMSRVLSGDLGQSIQFAVPVRPLLLDRFAVTAAVVVTAVAIAALIAVPAGLLAAWRQGSGWDLGVVATATLLMSVPSFWMGLLLLLVLGLQLGWLPVVGYVSMASDLKAGLIYLAMPVLTLVLVESGVLIRMARAAALEVLRLDYVAHARAKGLPEPIVLARHVLPNAFAPTWTLIGLVLGNLLGGIAVVETVFTLPGLGRLLVGAIFARDYPVIQGCMLFITFVYVLVNLVVDLLYPLFDPRVVAE
ncbi:ABC transporter permease [Aquabacterium sp.]|uniref:ABC transporter permease n=1 Tax=Aquabacterium sp. TaxID=1872578 RepID=UPI002C11622F|nr:ABC transporter permease [Aquabacterium sp.]HSW09136.1 ABC transporter permease [Aquabacterium sp.]